MCSIVEYRAVSGVFQNIDPRPPLHPASMSSPRTKGGGRGYYLAGRWGGGGVNILEDARHRIGLLQYNLSTSIYNHAPHCSDFVIFEKTDADTHNHLLK